MRQINGIFLLDKPIGISSNLALQKVKRLFNAKKAGHTGSLDPLATGLLPICFGEATKFSQYLLDADKTYSVTMRLGVRTTTSDAEGDVVSERPVPADLTIEKIDRLFDALRGSTQQVPSMFSALKHNGKPLYELARQGITVERQSRPITVFALTVSRFQDQCVDFDVHCSKGTYVRTIVDDFGELLGCGAHVTRLRRLSVGPYKAEMMTPLDDIVPDQATLLPVDSSLFDFSIIELSKEQSIELFHGKPIHVEQAPAGIKVRIYCDQEFLGLGEINDSNVLTVIRLISRQ